MSPARVLRRNHVTVAGDGPRTLVFGHGFGCDQRVWRHVAPAFEHDHRTVLFDYVGSGRSERAAYDGARYATLAGYAQDLIEVCEALALRDVVFVGHSVSAMVGLLAALVAPQCFERLVFVAPSPCYLNLRQADPPYEGGFERADLEGLFELMACNQPAWAGLLAPMVMQNGERPELAEELREGFCRLDPAVAMDFARATFLSDYRAQVAQLAHPTLLLTCSQDPVAPPAVGDYLQARLRRGRRVRLRASGHCPHLSHPAELIAELAQELQQPAAQLQQPAAQSQAVLAC
jgi:sigma-B regulation protein RsbQ